MPATNNLSLRARADRCMRDASYGDLVLLMVGEDELDQAKALVSGSDVVVMTRRELRPRWAEIMRTGSLDPPQQQQQMARPTVRRGVDVDALLGAIGRRR
jgi:hypothetical protein